MLEHVKIRVLPDGRLSRADAALFLGLTAKTLSAWQTVGFGPMPRHVGSRVFYRLHDLEVFVASGAREVN